MSGVVASLGKAQHVRVFGSDIYYMPAIQPGAGVSVIEQIIPPHDGDALQIDPTQEPKIRAKYGVEYIGPNPFIVTPSD